MRRVVAVLPVLLLLVAAPWILADQPETGRALERLRSTAPGRVESERSPGGDRTRTLRGDLTRPSAAAPRDIATLFLSENADLFGMRSGLADLRLARVKESPGGRHLRFQQTYRGLPVFDRGAGVHVSRDGRVVLVHNDYVPAIDISVEPGRSAAEAVRALARDTTPELGIFAGPVPGGPERVAPRLAYRLTLRTDSPFGVVESILDARTGAVLRSRSLVQDSHITGRGQVFDPNPVNTLGDTTLRDNGNADSPAFAPAYRIVNLPNLSRPFLDRYGEVMLNGPYVRVTDLIERPFLSAVSSPTGDFLFTRDRLEFENVMVYFHTDRGQRYVQSLGFTDIDNRPIRVDPHGLNGADNSHYVALPIGSGWIAFGQGGVDDAEDADVILHEYGHSIQDNSNPGAYSFLGETGAQGEGFGDYWAFTNGPTGPGAFDPACIGEWDFSGICLRRVDGTKHYPEDIVHEVHADGEIWSSALHEIHETIGRETTDAIILESHLLVPMFPMFCEGAHALRDADDLLHGGANRAAIGAATARRGIAGDFVVAHLAVSREGADTDVVHFEIANQGRCSVGGATHSVRQVCSPGQDPVEAGGVSTDTLPPQGSAAFDLRILSVEPGCVYTVTADIGNAEIETHEENNVAVSAP
jgi:fungalysin/thermolysin propeptide/fungalysin metallopeptidase (M36)